MDTRYTLFLGDKIIGEYEDYQELRKDHEGFFPVGSVLFSSSMQEWYDYTGMMITDQTKIPPYPLHLQLVLGL